MGTAYAAVATHSRYSYVISCSQKWMTKLSKLFFNVKYFNKSRLGRAWQWVLEAVPAS